MAISLKLNVTGEGTVYRNDKWGYAQYSFKLSNQINGIWKHKYIQVSFPKGTVLENGTQIDIKTGFFTFYETKDGLQETKIVVTSYDIMDQSIGDIDIPTENISDTDLPW